MKQMSVRCLYNLISNCPNITHIDFADGKEVTNLDILGNHYGLFNI
jgi:hypothetical protein